MTEIFLSYRRSDAVVVDHIHDKLEDYFGEKSVFLDRHMDPGAPFPNRIQSALGTAEVILFVIGKTWISEQDERTFRRRLDLPGDWVRQELESALAGKALVIPVLVDGARIPKVEQMPEGLGPIVMFQAIDLSGDYFREGMKKLIQ